MSDEYVYDPEQDAARTTQEVQVLATGILCELERLSQSYSIEISDMSPLLRLVTSSLKELDIVVEESKRSAAESNSLRSEVTEAERSLRSEQEARHAAEKRWLAVHDQADGERRVLESQIRSLKAHANQVSEKLGARELHYTRLMEELNELQYKHAEDRTRHAVAVRGYSQQLESLKRQLEEARIRSAPLTLCNSRTSQTTSDAEIISFAPNSDNQALLNGLHVLTSSNTLPVESSSEGSPRSSSPEGESGSALVGGPPELSDSRSYSHCPIASSNPAANGCLPAKLNFELDSVTSPRDSTTPSCSTPMTDTVNGNGETDGATRCLERELATAADAQKERSAAALEERLDELVYERASLLRERSDLKLTVANLTSDLNCSQLEHERLHQLAADLTSSLEAAQQEHQKSMMASAQKPAVRVLSKSLQSAVVPDASIQYRKDAERLMRLYTFYKDKSSMLQEQLSRMQMAARGAGDSGIMRLFNRVFSFKKRDGARSTMPSPLKSSHPILHRAPTGGDVENSPSKVSQSGSMTSWTSSQPPSQLSSPQKPCSIGRPPSLGSASARGDWLASQHCTVVDPPLLPSCSGQTALLASPQSRVCGCAAALSTRKSSTMPMRDLSSSWDTLGSSVGSCSDAYRQLWVASYDTQSQVEIFDVFAKGTLRHTGKMCSLPASEAVYPVACIKPVSSKHGDQQQQGSSSSRGGGVCLDMTPTGCGVSPVAGAPTRRRSMMEHALSTPVKKSLPQTPRVASFKRPSGCNTASQVSQEGTSTMWLAMASPGGTLLVYSTEAGSWELLETVRMEASGTIVCVQHAFGRVFVGLSNCSIAAFDQAEGTESGWNVRSWQSADLYDIDEVDMQYVRTSHGESQVMCMAAIDDQLWCTCGSTVLLLDPRTLQVESSFRITFPPITQMLSVDNIVIFASDLSPFVLFYHSSTCQLLQDFDLPSLTELVDSSAAEAVGVTCMQASSHLLWIGCSNGILLALVLHATSRVLEKPEDADAVQDWQEDSGVVSYDSAFVSQWYHMGPVCTMIPISVPGTSASARRTHDIVYTCGIGSMDARSRSDQGIQTRQEILSPQNLVRPTATSPQQDWEQQQQRQTSAVDSETSDDQYRIITWRL